MSSAAIRKGKCVVVSDFLDTDFLLSKLELLSIFYSLFRAMAFHVNCWSNLVRLLAISSNIQIFYTVNCTAFCC